MLKIQRYISYSFVIFGFYINFISTTSGPTEPQFPYHKVKFSQTTKTTAKPPKLMDLNVAYKNNYNFYDFKKFPSLSDYRDVIVHLQDWKYKDIQKECPLLYETGFAAVQISPVTAHAHFKDNPWDERLSVINYSFKNDSGNEEELEEMIEVCNKNHIKVFADVVINNMARSKDVDKKGKNFSDMEYNNIDGSLLYDESDFYQPCKIEPQNYFKDLSNVDNFVHDIWIKSEPEKNLDKLSTEEKENSSEREPDTVINFGYSWKSFIKIQNFYAEKLDKETFTKITNLVDHNNLLIVRRCQLYDRHDLRQIDENDKPMKQIVDLLLQLIYLGISGLRILAADHMDPNDLNIIYDWLPNQEVFIYQDVYDPLPKEQDTYLIDDKEYVKRARVTDYKYARILSRTFMGRKIKMDEMYDLKHLELLPSEDSVVFVNNSNTLGLGHRGFAEPVLEDMFIYPGFPLGDKALQLAIAFMLISNHGIPLITSSMDKDKKPLNEHSEWSTIKQMVRFRNVLKKHNQGIVPPPDKFQKHTDFQLSYCLGTTGYVAFNNEYNEMELKKDVNTCFNKDGIYCDVFGGGLIRGKERHDDQCKGNSMKVSDNGKKGELKMASYEGFAAFNIDDMIPS